MAQRKSLGPLLTESLTIFIELFPKIIGSVAIVYAFLIPLYIFLFSGVVTIPTQPPQGVLSDKAFVNSMLYLFIAMGASLLYQIAIIKILEAHKNNTSLRVLDAYQEAVVLFGPYLWVMLLVVVRLFLWSLLLIVPGVIFGILYGFSNMALILDQKRGLQALIMSKKIIKPHFWTFVGYSLVAILLTVPFSFFIRVVLKLLFGVRTWENFGLMPTLGESLNNFLVSVVGVYIIVFSYLLYWELKRRIG